MALHGHQREPTLEDPRVHDPPGGLPGDTLDRVPQVTGLRVPEPVRIQVGPYPFPEAVLAQELLQHAQHGSALLVRENVEHAVRVVRGHHRILDRPCAVESVDVEGGGAFQAEVRPAVPGGTERVDGGDLHEGGERLVQPDAVPPLHRDEVAEPHVGELVGDDLCHHGLLMLGRRGRVEEKQCLPEGDAAQVLHRAGREVRQGHEVELVARVRDGVVGAEPAQGESRHLQGVHAEVVLARRVQNADGDAVDVHSRRGLQGADHEGEEIRGHRDRVGEAHTAAAVAGGLLGDDGGVRHRREALGNHKGHSEDRLQVGLVETGEDPAGVRRLHLGGGDDVLDAVAAGKGGTVEAPQLVVEDSAELGVQGGGPGRHSPLQGQSDPLGLHVVGDLRFAARACAVRDPRGCDVELSGVQDDRVRGLPNVERDLDVAREGGGGEVRGEGDVVAPRHDGTGQTVGALLLLWHPDRIRPVRWRSGRSAVARPSLPSLGSRLEWRLPRPPYRGLHRHTTETDATCQRHLETAPRRPAPEPPLPDVPGGPARRSAGASSPPA